MAEQAIGLERPGPQIQPSKIFPQLFRRWDERERIRVLDVGIATPGTVAFFSTMKCRVHFRDLFSEPLIRDHDRPSEELDLEEEFSRLLQFPEGTQFDICLFWDFLNYLSRPALTAFGVALSPYVNRYTKAHGFGVHNAGTPLAFSEFSVCRPDAFEVTQRRGQPLRYFPHPQAELYEFLSVFDIERGVLLPDGKVEMLMRSTQ